MTPNYITELERSSNQNIAHVHKTRSLTCNIKIHKTLPNLHFHQALNPIVITIKSQNKQGPISKTLIKHLERHQITCICNLQHPTSPILQTSIASIPPNSHNPHTLQSRKCSQTSQTSQTQNR
ncbi:hypothetical protein KC19_11G106400 [Ceratodon purpureus]|uniref:Uncharacterized protein n=1 Tax=Ceratodon purpureus TaxID=3225 RepID=A0A8T0GFR3_CERPU|nr:hypothetical protein KC19_11G106400 [Ceratodon purpureus]